MQPGSAPAAAPQLASDSEATQWQQLCQRAKTQVSDCKQQQMLRALSLHVPPAQTVLQMQRMCMPRHSDSIGPADEAVRAGDVLRAGQHQAAAELQQPSCSAQAAITTQRMDALQREQLQATLVARMLLLKGQHRQADESQPERSHQPPATQSSPQPLQSRDPNAALRVCMQRLFPVEGPDELQAQPCNSISTASVAVVQKPPSAQAECSTCTLCAASPITSGDTMCKCAPKQNATRTMSCHRLFGNSCQDIHIAFILSDVAEQRVTSASMLNIKSLQCGSGHACATQEAVHAPAGHACCCATLRSGQASTPSMCAARCGLATSLQVMHCQRSAFVWT